MEHNEINNLIAAELKSLPKCSPNKPAAPDPRPVGFPPMGAYASKRFASESMGATQIMAVLRNIKLDEDVNESVKQRRHATIVSEIVRFAKYCGHQCSQEQAEEILRKVLE